MFSYDIYDMKQLFVLLLLGISLTVTAQKTSTSLWLQYYQQRQLPQLEKALANVPHAKKQHANYLLFTAALQNAWMQAETSDSLLDKITPTALQGLNDSLRYLYYNVRSDNAIKRFQYERAAAIGDILVNKYAAFMEADELKDMYDANRIWSCVKDEPAQTIQHIGSSAIRLKKDLAGLSNIPVTRGDSTYDFVFDTGAGISVVTESFAKQLDFTIVLDCVIPIKSGITGIPTNSRLAMARALRIGNMEIKDALFLIFPDSALSFGGGVYKISGIIGFPIIKEMGELRFRNDSLLVQPSPVGLPLVKNLAVDILKPYIFLSYNGTLLPFTFDTGAKESLFSKRFYTAYRSIIDATGEPHTQLLGGTNGNRSFKGFLLPAIRLTCHGQTAELKKAFVTTEEMSTVSGNYYGNIGKDFIHQFSTMLLDFKRACAKFE